MLPTPVSTALRGKIALELWAAQCLLESTACPGGRGCEPSRRAHCNALAGQRPGGGQSLSVPWLATELYAACQRRRRARRTEGPLHAVTTVSKWRSNALFDVNGPEGVVENQFCPSGHGLLPALS